MLADSDPFLVALVAIAAVGAGAINTLVGSGTLLTFPALVAVGLPPLSANVTNNVGLVFGSFAGTWGYRRELGGQVRRLAWLLPFSAAGGLTGALLLLVLPERVFDAVVPALVAVGLGLVIAQPALNRRSARAAAERDPDAGARAPWLRRGALVTGVFLAGIYGGYFGAAQGVILIGIMGVLVSDSLQRINAAKNALASAVNLVATAVFVAVAPDRIDWGLAGLVAAGAIVGAILASRFGRRLPPGALRGVVVAVGVVAIAVLLREALA